MRKPEGSPRTSLLSEERGARRIDEPVLRITIDPVAGPIWEPGSSVFATVTLAVHGGVQALAVQHFTVGPAGNNSAAANTSVPTTTVSVADGVGSVKLLQLSRRKWERLVASGVLSEACVAALRRVQEERAEMNAQALVLARPSRPPPRSDPLTPPKI